MNRIFLQLQTIANLNPKRMTSRSIKIDGAVNGVPLMYNWRRVVLGHLLDFRGGSYVPLLSSKPSLERVIKV